MTTSLAEHTDPLTQNHIFEVPHQTLSAVRSRSLIASYAPVVDGEQLISNLMHQYPEAFEAMKAVGIHPDNQEKIENIYLNFLDDSLKADFIERYKELTTGLSLCTCLDSERFDNVGLHCVIVGAGVAYLGKKFFAGNERKASEATVLGLLHDANKIAERQRENFLYAINVLEKSTEQYDKSLVNTIYQSLELSFPGLSISIREPNSQKAYHQYGQILARSGVKPNVIHLMLRAGEIAGHTSFPLFAKPLGARRFQLNTTIPVALLVHAVDAHISSPLDRSPSLILTPQDRITYSKFTDRYPYMSEKKFEGIPYIDFQPLLVKAMTRFIAEKMGFHTCNAETFLRDSLAFGLALYPAYEQVR